MRLLVSGCACSGTTLMIHLMQYFYNCKVLIEDEIHPIDAIEIPHKDIILTIKQPFLERSNINYFGLQEVINAGFKVIWMLRDGRDVICSRNSSGNFHASYRRWVDANIELLSLSLNPNLCLVRYESLVTNPSVEMDKISAFISQDYQKDYENFWLGMKASRMTDGIIPRPIESFSIGNYKNYPEVVDNALEDSIFRKLLYLFNYA